MQLSLDILTYGAAISEVPLFQITILAVQITILVVLKKITILAMQMQLPSQIVGGCSFGSSQIGWPNCWPSRGAV
jgi:hypothetical protein